MNFIISQICGFIAILLVCCSYFFNNKKSFLLFQIFANVFYASSFLFLNVLVGGISTFVSIFRCLTLFYYEKKNKTPPPIVFITFVSLYLICGILLFKNNYDYIAIISCQLFNLAMFIKNIKIVRFVMLPPNLAMITYNFLNQTYTNAILDCIEAFVIISAIVSYSLIKTQRQKLKYIS